MILGHSLTVAIFDRIEKQLIIIHIADYDGAFKPDNLEINNEAYNNPGVMVCPLLLINDSGYSERAATLRVGHTRLQGHRSQSEEAHPASGKWCQIRGRMVSEHPP